eukprot:TRINITY_DN97418_c0_g1_i1.p1 TRINITY_DN97418_c0_g1~~TRINITY_DN97418_c0_g1_i1.p1  ORF type:complete len:288 (+),score=34.51 TRINITY_DN97418_c0_g1_i1:117-866(+)
MARITISLAVILVEATGNTQWSLPILFTVLASKWIGDFFNEGIYDIHIGLKRIPLLNHFPDYSTMTLRASDVMTQTVVTLNTTVSVRELVDVLASCSHHGFPVVEAGTGQLHGMIERGVLHNLLMYGNRYGALTLPGSGAVPGQEQDEQQEPQALLMPYKHMAENQACFPSLQSIVDGLSEEDKTAELNLLPYTDSSTLAIQESSTLRRAHSLFRMLGVRHLPVLRKNGSLCGIISRKDLISTPRRNAV